MSSEFKLVTGLILVAVLSACGKSMYKPEQTKGFLSSYENLAEVESPSDAPSYRWSSKNLTNGKYNKLLIDTLIFFPEPETKDLESKQGLENIRQSVNQLLRTNAKEAGIELAEQTGEKVIRLKSAITSVDTSLKDFSVREIIPLRLIWAGAELALGARDRDFILLFEYELVDSVTGEVMVRGVRRVSGEQLENDKSKVTLDNAKPIMERLVKDFEHNFKLLAAKLN